jgi:hypothetical protein
MMTGKGLSTILINILASALLSGCGQSASNIPEIPKDICAKTGKTLTKEEKIINAIVHVYNYDKTGRMGGYGDFIATHYTRFMSQDITNKSDEDVRKSARKYYLQNSKCCEVLEPWYIRDIKKKKGLGDYDWRIELEGPANRFEWVNDVNLYDLDNKFDNRPLEVEIGNCGETSLRFRG